MPSLQFLPAVNRVLGLVIYFCLIIGALKLVAASSNRGDELSFNNHRVRAGENPKSFTLNFSVDDDPIFFEDDQNLDDTGDSPGLGDGYCHSEFNSAADGYDGGDCCLESCLRNEQISILKYTCGSEAPYNCIDPIYNIPLPPANMTDQLVLSTFFSSMDGSQWDNNTAWNTSSPLGTWYGITVDSSLPEENNVIKITLSNNNLFGGLPTEIGYMKNLRVINLEGNKISGTLPSELCKLINLSDLILSGNFISGSIPTCVGQLSNPNNLDLMSNSFPGNVLETIDSVENPIYLFVHQKQLTETIPMLNVLLGNLEHLRFDDNFLTGTIPSSVGHLTKLTDLYLQGNDLSGVIPESIGTLISLNDLFLSKNYFTESIPSTVGALTNLQRLELSSIGLTGTIPSTVGKLTKLTHLFLYDNYFKGAIPETIASLKNLVQLHLQGNDLSGVIPESIGTLISLNDLFLSKNYVTGSIPSTVGELTNLQQLDLSSIYLSGTIPSTVGKLIKLTHLFLDGNLLSGVIAEDIGSLTKLEYLRLQLNRLTGPIPESLGSLGNVVNLDLQYNFLRGTIPSSIGHLTKLTQLFLNGNKLSGVIPETIASLGNLNILRLGENKLSGVIPESIGTLISLNDLFLSNNFFSGSIPSTVGELTNLQQLELLLNVLTGTIPSTVGKLTKLTHLFLDSNQLSGVIAEDIGSLTKLVFLGLDRNLLTGPIPDSLGSLGNVVNLDLEYNSLTGTIPSSLGALSNLYYLYLSQNMLSGTIPSSVGDMKKLLHLYLNDNHLSGTIPSTINSLNKLLHLNLYRNQLNGTIPTIGSMTSLKNLYLYENQLSGTIPSTIAFIKDILRIDCHENRLRGSLPSTVGSLTALRELILYQNQLSGVIPSTVGGMRSLQVFDLSSNQLTGTLPSTISRLSFVFYIFKLSHNKLKGAIPSDVWRMKNSQIIDLSWNQLTGTIPSSVGLLLRLKTLDLSANSLTGSIPRSIGRLFDLIDVYLNQNYLTGNISFSLLAFTSLRSFHVQNNRLSGSLQFLLRNSTTVEDVDISDNLFSDRIFDAYGDSMKSLKYFGARNLPRSCYVLSFLQLVPSFEYFNTIKCQDAQDIALCSLAKSISIEQQVNNAATVRQPIYGGAFESSHDPVGYGYGLKDSKYFISSLSKDTATVFLIQFDRRTDIPDSLDFVRFCVDKDCSQILWDSRTGLGASEGFSRSKLPKGTVNITSNGNIYLWFHNDDKSLPSSMKYGGAYGFRLTISKYVLPFVGWKCEPLQSPELSMPIMGSFPAQPSSFSLANGVCDGVGWSGVSCSPSGAVISIKLPSLAITGQLPTTIGLLSDLIELDLSNNVISGKIPTELGLLSKLEYAYLEYNALDGTISSHIGKLGALRHLSLNYNLLSGTLPSELGKCYNLQTLDLSRNRLKGILPGSLRDLQSLESLYVYSNNLEGPISLSLTNLSRSLKVLSFSSNRFTGKVTEDLCALKDVNIDSTDNVGLTCFDHCWIGYRGMVRSDVSACMPSSLPTTVPSSKPSNQPSSMPSNPTGSPTSQPTKLRVRTNSILAPGIVLSETTVITVSFVIGGGIMILSCLCYYWLAYYRRRIYKRDVDAILAVLPVHKAILDGCSTKDIIELIKLNPLTLHQVDHNGDTSFDLALKRDLDANIISEILRHSLPYDTQSKSKRDSEDHGYAWARIVQENEKYVTLVDELLDENSDIVFELVNARAEDGVRKVIDIAFPAFKAVLHKHTCFMKRFEFLNTSIYKSESTIVYSARDLQSPGACSVVALKFVKSKANYDREVAGRNQAMGAVRSSDEANRFLVSTVQSFDIHGDLMFKKELHRWKELQLFSGVLVMSLGEKSVKMIMATEPIAGRDWEEIRRMTMQIAESLQHLHASGIIHGDIKLSNILRVENRLKLIDFDASAAIHSGFSGAKISLAYVPPELLYHDTSDDSNTAVARAYDAGIPLLHAHPAHDSWSYGVTLFNICSKHSFFHANDDDEIKADDLWKLYQCSDDFLNQQLDIISDKLARNLLSQLLVKDPAKRINMTQVLDHPFVSGKKATRMINQPADFDVMISYRVKSDQAHALLLFDMLTNAGLKVWLDAKCLAKGVSWEAGFCDGLLRSRVFVPLMSRGSSEAFVTLTETSYCDNVLLEYNLALELRERGLVEFIYPVFISDCVADVYIDDCSGCFPNLSSNGHLHVETISTKLKEHLSRLALGSMLLEKLPTKQVFQKITINQGSFVKGPKATAFDHLVDLIKDI